MTTVDETVEYLKGLVQAQQAQLNKLTGNTASLDSPPTTYPEGSRPFDFRPPKVRAREKAIAKLRVLARTRGGMWDDNPRVASVYGHRQGDEMTAGCEFYGEDEFKPSCHRTCWTPETETRFLYALGLKDLATSTLVPLTPPDQKKDRSMLEELVGHLRNLSSGTATTQDVTGSYPDRPPTREEVGTAQGAVRIRKLNQ